jgi:hypothetical protein
MLAATIPDAEINYVRTREKDGRRREFPAIQRGKFCPQA